MGLGEHCPLVARIRELEEINQGLRQTAAWAVMRLRAAADGVLEAVGDLERELIGPLRDAS